MLNPKLIERYGEESREIFEKLVEFLGDEYAPQMYVITMGATVINGVTFPERFGTNFYRGITQEDIVNFMSSHYESGVDNLFLVQGKDPDSSDIPLLVGRNVKRAKDIEKVAKSILKDVGMPGAIKKAVQISPLLGDDYFKDSRVRAGLMRINKKIPMETLSRILSVAESKQMSDDESHMLADWVMRKIVQDYVPDSAEIVKQYDAVDKYYDSND